MDCTFAKGRYANVIQHLRRLRFLTEQLVLLVLKHWPMALLVIDFMGNWTTWTWTKSLQLAYDFLSQVQDSS